jgi:hypothetical protein
VFVAKEILVAAFFLVAGHGPEVIFLFLFAIKSFHPNGGLIDVLTKGSKEISDSRDKV